MRRDAALALALSALALALQLPIALRWVNYTDEGRVLQAAAEIDRGKVLYRDVIMPDPGPGVFYLLAGLLRATGPSLTAARLAIAALSSAMAGLLYLIARGAMPRWPALLAGLGFVPLRMLAFPVWHGFHYASCGAFLVTLAFALLLVGLRRARPGLVAVAGAVGGLGFVTRQDLGAASLLALLIATALVAERPARRASVVGLAVGAGLVVLGVVTFFTAQDALGPLVQQTVLTPLAGRSRGVGAWSYQQMPALRPFLAQDPVLRASLLWYAPSIVGTLYWDALVGSRVFQQTGLVDAAVKSAFVLPAALVVLGALATAAGWLRQPATAEAARRRRGALLVVLLGAAALAAFNPPHDWYHLAAIAFPVPLLAALVIDRMPGRTRRPALVLATACALAALAVTVRVHRDLRRQYDTPVRTHAGTVWLAAADARPLADLLAYVDAQLRPEDPLPVFPYFPIVQFLAARPAGTSTFFIWPERPPDDTDERLVAELEAARPRLVVYSPTQPETLLRHLRDNAPGLFAYLVDHYRIVRSFVPDRPGVVFTALAPHTPEPALFDLAALLDQAAVRVARDGTSREVTGNERAAIAGVDLWPFRRVIYARPTFGGTTTLAFPLRLPAGSHLRFGYGINLDRWSSPPAAAITFRVSVVTGDGTERELWRATVDPGRRPPERDWQEEDLDLAGLGSRDVTLLLATSTDARAGEVRDLAAWAEPRVVRPDG